VSLSLLYGRNLAVDILLNAEAATGGARKQSHSLEEKESASRGQ
jgi:hypothetical protein